MGWVSAVVMHQNLLGSLRFVPTSLACHAECGQERTRLSGAGSSVPVASKEPKPRFVLTIEHDDRDQNKAERYLKALLKRLGRSWGFTCVDCRQVDSEEK